jgi:hypothetical protein
MTMRGEKVYECDFDVTGVTDFGITLDAILSGKEKIPPQGARVDVAYAGTIKGRVSGSIRGVDYQVIRADGRLDLDTRATVETTDGRRIALSASGVVERSHGLKRKHKCTSVVHHSRMMAASRTVGLNRMAIVSGPFRSNGTCVRKFISARSN